MKHTIVEELKLEIQRELKYNIDFIIAVAIVWFGIFAIWSLDYTSYNKSILNFMLGSFLLPLAFTLSKLFHVKNRRDE